MTKVHRRKYQADPMSFARVIALTELFNDKEVRAIVLPARVSFDLIVGGKADHHDIARLIDTANVTMVRCWETPMQPIAQVFLGAIQRCWERYERLQKIGLDGPAIADIEQGLELHEELVRKSTPRQMREAAMVVDEGKTKWMI